MSKQEFYRSLTEEQREYVDFLVDSAYVKGIDQARTEEYARWYYERY